MLQQLLNASKGSTNSFVSQNDSYIVDTIFELVHKEKLDPYDGLFFNALIFQGFVDTKTCAGKLLQSSSYLLWIP